MTNTLTELSKLCFKCQGECCKHVALEIDKPTCKRDYDNIRWYLAHKNVEVFIDDSDDWYIKFFSDCEYLAKDGKCANYEERPKICREYPSKDAYCEYEGEEDYYKFLFKNDKEFTEYLNKKNITWEWKKL